MRITKMIKVTTPDGRTTERFYFGPFRIKPNKFEVEYFKKEASMGADVDNLLNSLMAIGQ